MKYTIFDYARAVPAIREVCCRMYEAEMNHLRNIVYRGGSISDSKLRRVAIKNMTNDLARVLTDFAEVIRDFERMIPREYN